ncbi:MAG: PKD domain-containing protein, partial [Gemmatimonadales bacterium]
GGPYAGAEGSAITFTGSATDPGSADVLTYQWDFNYVAPMFDIDATGLSPTHAYAQQGDSTAALRVLDDDGGISGVVTAVVTVSDAGPTANFTFAPASPRVGQLVSFTNQSTSVDAPTWEWDLDPAVPGPESTVQNPTYTYSAAGEYLVTLTVRESDGDVVTSAPKTVSVTTQPPVVLYFSLRGADTLSGVVVANEDIVACDGTTFSLYFDGSDVGLGSFTLAAFSILPNNEILMAFRSAGTVAGIAFDDSDILKFTATSLGATTAGTFSLYFDGSDVGLTSDDAEDIDAVELLADGRLLISTKGSPSVTGLSGLADEDILAFTPTSLGATTAGTWAIYFDGSDVGLSDSSDEDVDAVAVDASGRIYLSTLGNFSVTGVSGADEDVFVFTPTSLGSTTAGTYSPTLFFDGDVYGVTGDIFGIDLP